MIKKKISQAIKNKVDLTRRIGGMKRSQGEGTPHKSFMQWQIKQTHSLPIWIAIKSIQGRQIIPKYLISAMTKILTELVRRGNRYFS